MARVHSPDADSDLQIRLTKRESEVLGLVIEGKSNKEVASELYCSKRTVDFHIARIYDKLNVSNRIQAVRRAALLGLLQATPDHMDLSLIHISEPTRPY